VEEVLNNVVEEALNNVVEEALNNVVEEVLNNVVEEVVVAVVEEAEEDSLGPKVAERDQAGTWHSHRGHYDSLLLFSLSHNCLCTQGHEAE